MRNSGIFVKTDSGMFRAKSNQMLYSQLICRNTGIPANQTLIKRYGEYVMRTLL